MIKPVHAKTIKLTSLLILALFQSTAFGAVYKCEEGGKTVYQATPCAGGQVLASKDTESPQKTAPSKDAAIGQKKCVGKELRINFTDMPLKTTLQLLADFSGNKLAAEPSVNGSGAFNYDCVPWDTVLHDIASRHNLSVKVEQGTIFAKKR